MHPNPVFRKETEIRNLNFARERSFGTLAMNAEDGPLLSHIPFRILEDNKTVELHLVRSNPIVRALKDPQSAIISVMGADSYISPDWYGIQDQVPTWNYVAVHLRGKLSLLPQEKLHDVLSGISEMFENRLSPKKPWVSDKMDPEIYAKMQRQIVPIKMDVQTIDGTWKLGQNKPDEVRIRAGRMVGEYGIGNEVKTISGLMIDPSR